MSTGVGVTVMVDGTRLEDGSPGDDVLTPTALSGLSVTWGRSTTMDQPAMASCSFEVLDLPGGTTFAERIRTGSRVDVLASGLIFPGPSESTFVDPGFDTGAGGRTPINAGTALVPAAAGVVLRRNLATDPRATVNATPAAGALAWAPRWFGDGNGTTSIVTGAGDGPVPGVTSYMRKRWTVAPPTDSGDIGFTHTNGFSTSGTRTTGYPVTPGTTYTLTSYLRASQAMATTGTGWAIRVAWRTAAGAFLSVTAIPAGTVSLPAGVWTRIVLTATAPATATLLEAVTSSAGQVVGGVAVNATLDGTALMLEPAAAPSSYFDGATTDTPERDYAWTAGANASTSTESTVAVSAHLRVDVDDATRRSGVQLAPAAFVPSGTSPDAWDSIPATSPGQTWDYGARVRAAPGALVEVRPILYHAPWSNAATVVDLPLVFVGDGNWWTVEGTFVPDVPGRWIGVEVTTFPAGRAWDEHPPTLTWDAYGAGVTWDATGRLDVDDVAVLAPADGTVRTVDVFVGRVTDVEASFDEGIGAAVVKVTAVDLIADLENRYVGDEPWPAEPLGTRAVRVLTLAGGGVPIDIAPTLAPLVVSWRDVDRQGAFGLIGGLAVSSDGVLWPAAHAATGAYLVLEDTAERAPLREVALVGGVVTVITTTDPDVDALHLSACDLLREPVTWTQTVADVLTRASAGWKEQTLDDEGNPATADHTETVIDAPAEMTFGPRAASVSTELTTAGDATNVATRLLARSGSSDWRAQGITLDDRWNTDSDAADVTVLLDLLDGTRRIGAGLLLSDLPGTWTPITGDAPVYVEGGTYTFDQGAWVLELTVSNARGQGQSAAWDEMTPTWQWDQWDPAVSWNDLRGAAAPGGV